MGGSQGKPSAHDITREARGGTSSVIDSDGLTAQSSQEIGFFTRLKDWKSVSTAS